MLGYLFFVGDRSKTDLPLRRASRCADNAWFRLRHEAALTPEPSCAWPKPRASATGFNDFKLRAACCAAMRKWMR